MSEINKKDLLSRWLNRSKDINSESSARSNEILPMPSGAPRKLTYGQRRLWMLQQLYSDNPFYNYAEIYTIKGVIDVMIFENSISQVVNRHDILRAIFEDSENDLIQSVTKGDTFHFIFKSCTENEIEDKERIKNEFAQRIGGASFDLTQGPLVRIGLLHLSANTYILIVNMHHIITDKWSMRVFREELAEIYNSLIKGKTLELESPKLQYADFAHWEQKKDIDKKQLDFWLSRLANAPEILNLPFDFKRPIIPSHKGAFCKREIDDSIANKIDVLCKKNNTTHFVFYLTVFTILLQRYCRQDDILLGTPISNRSQSALERMIGFFNETIVLRFNLDSQLSFTDYLQGSRKNVLDAFANKDIPLELLIKELGINRDVGINPLFQTMFLYHKVPEKPVWEGFDIDYETLDSGVSKFDLTLYVAEDEYEFAATIEYATDLFDEETIIRMHDCYAFLLAQITENPDILISSLELATDHEKNEIYRLNQNDKPYPGDKGIHEIIIEQLQEYGSAKAVSFGENYWTYEDLIRNATKIKFQLDVLGVSKGDVVAVCTDRSVEMVGAIIGVLMVGAVYMPVDPSYPIDRIRYMLEEARSKFVLCDEEQEELFSSTIGECINYKSIIEDDNHFDEILNVNVSSDDTAYLIFTSGSSGKPKGVSVSHGNIIHSTLARDYFYPTLPKCFLLMSSFAFDSSMVGLFWTLCRGGNLVLTPEKIEQDMDKLSRMIVKHEVSHTLMLPTLYQILLDQTRVENLRSLKCVIVAGEACHSKMCADHFQKLPSARLYNEYGPTEASVWCTGYEITIDDLNKSIPIGPAISSSDIFILNENGHMVPRGIPGEIYIGGRGITKGYINRPDLTAEKFVEHDFQQEFPSKLYKSGDLGKMKLDGVLEFLGRVDHQIKIRGFRVELTEIQNVLQSISEFDEVVVVAIKNSDQNASNNVKSIIAYFVALEEVDTKKIKNQLSSKLPEYMIPSLFVKMDKLPKLPNGKYDYKNLENKDISEQLGEGSSYTAPRNKIENALVEIWEDVLSIKPIGIYDNFFSLGGDSILSIQINGRAHNLGLKFPANEIFKSQTIAELSQHVELKIEAQEDKIYVGTIDLTPIQRWYLSNFKNKPGHWHLGVRFDLHSKLDQNVLSDVIRAIVERHESLRLKLESENSHVAYAGEFVEDNYLKILHPETDAESDRDVFIEFIIKEECSSVKLEEGPLFKCLYFDYANNGNGILILLAHHLVVDQVSWYILIEELANAIPQKQNNRDIDLGAKSTSYHQWTPKMKDYMKSAAFKQDFKYWKEQFADQNARVKNPKMYQEKDVVRTTIKLNPTLTLKVTNELLQKFDAKVDEILLSSLTIAMNKWKKLTSLVVETEGHGRESLDNQTTFHNSVGWFTSLYPIFLENDESRDSHSNLQYIKNKVRSVPSKGLTYGMCKFLMDGELNAMFDYDADVLFNYLGKRSALQNDFLGKATMLKMHLRSESSERAHPLEINAYIENDQMVLECSYVKQYTDASGFETFLKAFQEELINISEQKEVSTAHNYVPADFQEVDFDEEDLDALFEQL